MQSLAQFASEYGFCNAAYVLMPRARNFNGSIPDPIAMMATPSDPRQTEAWLRYYRSKKGFLLDFAYAACLQTTLPFAWVIEPQTIRVIGLEIPLHAAHIALAREGVRHTGVRAGLTTPLFLPNGGAGYVSLLTKDSQVVETEAIGPLKDHMLIIGHRFHDAVRRLVDSGDERSDLPPLSAREQECLHWAANGKAIEEIAAIIGISYGTVRFHLQNAERKLGVVSRSHAIAKAAFMGIINPVH